MVRGNRHRLNCNCRLCLGIAGFQKGEGNPMKNPEISKKVSIAKKNKPLSIEHKLKIKLSLMGKNKGKKRSEEGNRKAVETRRSRGSYIRKKGIYFFSEDTKTKMRMSAFEYAKRICNIICPRVGHNEKQILDKLEQEIKYKILRQYKVEGYFVDGYIPELNLVIEVDERPKISVRDIEREKIIKKKLECKFLRIKDYD